MWENLSSVALGWAWIVRRGPGAGIVMALQHLISSVTTAVISKISNGAQSLKHLLCPPHSKLYFQLPNPKRKPNCCCLMAQPQGGQEREETYIGCLPTHASGTHYKVIPSLDSPTYSKGDYFISQMKDCGSGRQSNSMD